MEAACAEPPRPEPAPCIKQEPEAAPKPEPRERRPCAACGASVEDWLDAAAASTPAGSALAELLARLLGAAPAGAAGAAGAAAAACRDCAALLAELERAEAEYRRLKQEFDEIIARNPLYHAPPLLPGALLQEVKNEAYESDYLPDHIQSDSEDEPLAAKRTRVSRIKKKKTKKKDTSLAQKKRKALKKTSPGRCDEDEFSLDNYAIKQEIDIPLEDFKDGSMILKMEEDDSAPAVEVKFAAPKRRGRPAGSGRGARREGPAKTSKKDMFSCDQCRAKYSSKERLARHTASHGDGPPYICEVCGASYKHRRACEIHVALHKGISKWKCEECNRLFPSKGALERHNNIHTGKLNYQCDLCGKSFIHTSSFKMHKLAHSGLKPHACHVCGLALMTSSHLKRHLRIHSGEKRYECDHCGRRFSERYNLAAHARSHARPEPEPEPARGGAGAAGAAGAGAAGAGGAPAGAGGEMKPRVFGFRCPYCPERACRKYLLERHVAAAHGRPLERSPARPRNTMSKMLKAQAARRPGTETPEQKDLPSSPPRAEPLKLTNAALPAPAPGAAPAAWGGGFVAEFSRLHSSYPQ